MKAASLYLFVLLFYSQFWNKSKALPWKQNNLLKTCRGKHLVCTYRHNLHYVDYQNVTPRLRISAYESQKSDAQHMTLSIWNSAYDTQNITLTIRHSVYVTKHTTLSIWHSAYDTQHMTFSMTLSIWHSAYDTQHMTLSIWHSSYDTHHMALIITTLNILRISRVVCYATCLHAGCLVAYWL